MEKRKSKWNYSLSNTIYNTTFPLYWRDIANLPLDFFFPLLMKVDQRIDWKCHVDSGVVYNITLALLVWKVGFRAFKFLKDSIVKIG
jgi:hypothetical protein